MAVVTIQVVTTSGRIFSKDEVEIYQMPRVGEQLELGTLVGVTELQNSSVEVKSVVHRIAKRGVIPPIVILNGSEVDSKIMANIVVNWDTFHSRESV